MLDKTGKNFHLCVYLNLYITSLQASSLSISGAFWQRGRKKEGEIATPLYQKSRCKMSAKCWLAEMTLVMFFNVCLHLRLFPLLADWRKSDSSVDREPEGNWRWNSNSRDIVACSPSFSRPAALENLIAGLYTTGPGMINHCQHCIHYNGMIGEQAE